MAFDAIDASLRESGVRATSANFSRKVSSFLSRREKKEAEEILFDEFWQISRFLDKVEFQEAASVRNCLKCRWLANYLVSAEGEILFHRLPHLIELLEKNLYSLSPGYSIDISRDEHILSRLKLLLQDKEVARLIKNMSRPVSNRLAEEMIRDTLDIPLNEPVTDAYVRRASIAALFTTLRQSLGSCFATAPAILIHTEQPQLFLKDLDEMMHTGRLKRIFSGVEYDVPMSFSWGNGDLKRPFILSKNLKAQQVKVWYSPGLVIAMEAVGVLPKKAQPIKKVARLHRLLGEAVLLIERPGAEVVSCPEELIRVLLLHHHNIKQKDVDHYLTKPKGMLGVGLIAQVPKSSKLASAKKDPCVAFLKDFEAAKRAFKMEADCALLKAWEFTLASFSEIKLSFTRFNLYSSLGVNYDEEGGIGQRMHSIISRKIEDANAEVKEFQEKYDDMFVYIRYLETRLRQASTESEIQWLKVEYQSRRTEVYHVEQLRNMAHDKAVKFSHLYDILWKTIDEKFFDYFQEVYDPEIHDISSGPFDDSPAGFRLVYKHGRTNPSLWTRIYTLSEFVESLVSFFTLVEQEMRSSEELASVEEELGFIITDLITHIRGTEFLESCFHRMSRAHNMPLVDRPLDNLDQIPIKPWVYTSGGSMSTLVSAYFRRDDMPTENERWVESPVELLAFLLDTLKQIGVGKLAPFLDDKKKSLLMHSPTHAFLLKPGLAPFCDGWTKEIYAYSWIKHFFLEPAELFWKSIWIEEDQSKELINELYEKVPPDFRPRFSQVFSALPTRLQTHDWCDWVGSLLSSDRGLRGPYGPIISPDDVDSLLYSHLPFTRARDVGPILIEIASSLFSQDSEMVERFHNRVDSLWGPPYEKEFISSGALRELISSFYAMAQLSTRSSKPIEGMILDEMRKRSLAAPAPAIFADTNWMKDYFAFVVSPATYDIELWSVDYLGACGRPVSYWNMWLNGSRKDPRWGVFINAHEYRGIIR